MKKIEDYLPLYYGCECLWEDNEGNTGGRTELDSYTLTGFYDRQLKVRPILRPLADILNTEAFEVYKLYFGKEQAEDWSGDTGSAYYSPKKVRVMAEHALRIFRGEDYETGDFMKVVSIVPYLLKQGFDLFNLIPEGLAVDKTITKK